MFIVKSKGVKMQEIVKIKFEDFKNKIDLEMEWLKFLDELYFTSQKIVLNFNENELDFLSKNEMCREKLKVVLWKNKNNVTLADNLYIEGLEGVY